MSAEEVIIRIKDKMSQLTPEIRKAFLSLDKKGKGRITKRQFREVGDFCFFVVKNLEQNDCYFLFKCSPLVSLSCWFSLLFSHWLSHTPLLISAIPNCTPLQYKYCMSCLMLSPLQMVLESSRRLFFM